mmetsp:Transcript_23491/g.63194  ORF Transcript_23491/g.63194 Transcript_23491/m.63194 type:complete len:132 (-) Transcript_23491:3684-4079(-)
MVVLVGRTTHAQTAGGECAGCMTTNNKNSTAAINNSHQHHYHNCNPSPQLEQAEQLPHGWKSGADASCGRQCYFHLETRSSSWISPCDTSVPSEGRYPPELRIGISIEQVRFESSCIKSVGMKLKMLHLLF